MSQIIYSKSIIYKLSCKDTDVTEIYIGSTTNYRNRKFQHKSACVNENHPEHLSYKYFFIRDHGGIDNWDMIEIEQYNATNKRDLEQKERYWIDRMKPHLNKNRPFINRDYKKEYYEYQKEYQKKYKVNHKEQLKEYQMGYQRKYKVIHRLQLKEYQKKYQRKKKQLGY